jgi:glycosyltransferase involved in cell wall biosynthesis
MENSDDSLVSVIIPLYNGEAFISQTLQSVLNQTYKNLEILVVDDGSRDRAPEIVKEFARKDHRIRLLQQENAGVAAARNLGIQNAKGELIAPIDADDIWFPNNIALQVEAMEKGGSEVGVVYSWSIDIDENDQPKGGFRAAKIRGNVYSTLIAHNFIGNASATLIRRSCLEQLGGYDCSLREQQAQGCEDWDLYLRIAEYYQFEVVPEFLIGYRKLSNSMSCNYQSMAKSHALVMASIQKKYPDFPQYLFNLSSSNLYIYFAHQSYHNQDFEVARFWLKKALQRDPITSLIRPGFYRMLISSLIASRDSSSLIKEDANKTEPPRVPINVISFQAPRLTKKLMIGVGQLFHWVIHLFVQLSRFRPKKLKLTGDRL